MSHAALEEAYPLHGILEAAVMLNYMIWL